MTKAKRKSLSELGHAMAKELTGRPLITEDVRLSWWYGPDHFDLYPPYAKEERVFVEFSIRKKVKKK